MTAPSVTALRKLAEEATPGPWIAGDDDDSDYFLIGPCDVDGIVYQPIVKLHSEANAAHLAAANPQAIISLLDYIETLEKDAGRYQYLRSRDPRKDPCDQCGHDGLHLRTGHLLDCHIDDAMG